MLRRKKAPAAIRSQDVPIGCAFVVVGEAGDALILFKVGVGAADYSLCVEFGNGKQSFFIPPDQPCSLCFIVDLAMVDMIRDCAMAVRTAHNVNGDLVSRDALEKASQVIEWAESMGLR